MEDYKEVSLATLRGGAAIEMFDDALKQVLENIYDPNTRNSTREINLKVIFFSDRQDPSQIKYKLSISKKLAQPRETENLIFSGKKNGEIIAYEQNIDQGNLPFFKNDKIKIMEAKNDK